MLMSDGNYSWCLHGLLKSSVYFTPAYGEDVNCNNATPAKSRHHVHVMIRILPKPEAHTECMLFVLRLLCMHTNDIAGSGVAVGVRFQTMLGILRSRHL